MSFEVRRITPEEVGMMNDLLSVFADAFDDPEHYNSNRPRADYLRGLLGDPTFIALAAVEKGRVAGGLAAYVLRKFEQERSEIYIYDLAVAEDHRRKGIATALIEELRRIALTIGAWVIYVQADTTPDDEPAIALYTKLGTREEVLHFDIAASE